MEGWAVQRRLLVTMAGAVEGERASNHENLYTRRDRVSIICETTPARTTARHPGQHPARCMLSAGLCAALFGTWDAVPSEGGHPYAPAPLNVAYRDRPS